LNLIGRVLRPHGRRGYIRALPIKPSLYEKGEGTVFKLKRREENLSLVVEEIKPHGKFVLIKFKGINTIEDAENLRGFEIYVEEAEEEEYIGMEVWEGKRFIGKVKDVMEIPMNTVLVVEKKEGGEILIPFSFCEVKSKKIMVSLPDGLEEI